MTSIEAFHLHSSCENWPNCVISRNRFEGSLDIGDAKKAWLHCISRQKYSSWNITPTGRPYWKVVADKKRLEQIADSTFHEVVLDRFPEDELEITLPGLNDRGIPEVIAATQDGFGLWCVHSTTDNRVMVIFAVDHALTDGVAGMGFVRDWMTAYHNLRIGADIGRGLAKLDWLRWKSRSQLGLLNWSFLKYLPCQAIGLFGATKFIFRKFSTIECKSEFEPKDINFPGIVGRTLPARLTEELSDRAERLGVSTNSLLMTILFRALKRIRSSIESKDINCCDWQERDWLRLVVPIGIRGIADRKLPLTNKTSLVQVERTFEQVANADGAAQSLDREIRIIMGFKLDFVFLIAIRLASIVPGLVRWIASNQKSRGTAVFTNLGEPFRKTRACNFGEVGELKLLDYDVCGPLRSGTPLNFAWSTFRKLSDGEADVQGRLSLHFDRKIISRDAANIVIEAFANEISDVAQFGGSTG
jgi:hypothetical protein